MFQEVIVWLRRYISPMFILLFVASFVLWYIAKLNYNYTTDIDVKLSVAGEKFTVPCVVEGKGTNLFSYRFYATRRLTIPLMELSTERIGADSMRIDMASLQNAIALRFSDIKIVALEAAPVIKIAQE